MDKLTNMKYPFLLLVCTLIGLSGCKYDVEEELYPPNDCNTNNITYSGTVLSIIETNCYVCHSAAANNGGVTLEGYSSLKTYVDNGKLLGTIKRLVGFSPMPQNAAKLPDCNINEIEAWIDDGAEDN